MILAWASPFNLPSVLFQYTKKACESACFSVILAQNKLFPHSPLSDPEHIDLVFY